MDRESIVRGPGSCGRGGPAHHLLSASCRRRAAGVWRGRPCPDPTARELEVPGGRVPRQRQSEDALPLPVCSFRVFHRLDGAACVGEGVSTQPSTADAGLFQKRPHRLSRNILSAILAPLSPAKLTQKINHHRCRYCYLFICICSPPCVYTQTRTHVHMCAHIQACVHT